MKNTIHIVCQEAAADGKDCMKLLKLSFEAKTGMSNMFYVDQMYGQLLLLIC